MILFDEVYGPSSQGQLVTEIDRIVSTLADDHVEDGFEVCSLSTGENYYDFVDSVQAIDGVYLVEPYYLIGDSAFLVNRRFNVAFEETVSREVIDSINASFGVVIKRELEYMPNVFVLYNTDSSGYSMLNLANAYYQLDETKFSHPEFSVKFHKASYNLYDYYNSEQWHIKKVIGDFNEASVWDFAGLGDTTTVAVIDDGVTYHADLPYSRILTGIDVSPRNGYDYDPTPGPEEAHGMACAGIIAASHSLNSSAEQDESSGVISLNPNTLIMPVKIADEDGEPTYTSNSDVADAFEYAYQNGADVLSFSWCWGYFGCISPSPELDLIITAIEDANTLGRGGLGCPVIISSGNAGSPCVCFPSCISSAFCVGAVTENDIRWSYSNYSDELDIVAPSGYINNLGDVWTLDQMDLLGVNPTLIDDCVPSKEIPDNGRGIYCHFGGTSAATPIVAGVASLLIAKDSTLTAEEIYDIIRYSAVSGTGGIPEPEDLPSYEYGWGRVDAFRAILSLARGDCNNDGVVDNADLSTLIDILFVTLEPAFPSPLLADCSCDGSVDGVDLGTLIDHLYISLDPLPRPCFEYGD